MKIFDQETTNTTSAATQLYGDERTVWCYGTFGGATVKLQVSPDGTEWFDVDELTFTAKGTIRFYPSGGTHVRGVIASGTAASLTLEIS